MFSVVLLVSCGLPTIDKGSEEFDYIDITVKGIITYKGESFRGILTKTYENGHFINKGTYKYGRKDGVFEGYYENSQLKSKTTFKDGRRVN